ncbi:ABC transporter permease [Vallicoccus soli]|uniref:Transport permease protein n=1 Tax=Vallicoccus soli TaxID=2339232 RepID=A0A3A3Z0X6_9ACTN|nr:ABC transporter permease [Vallicoccus soli]RJK96066.1 ABC transporter permease [Vallicoccus soli]
MSATTATAGRVLTQVRHDHRTLALLLVVPAVLMGLLAWVYADTPEVFDRVGPGLLGVFPLVVMFLVTSVATLRERTGGTLERLMTLPLGKGAFVGGYALAFGLLAAAQALVVSALALTVYGLDVAGPVWAVVGVAVLDALLGTALGLLVSAFAASEFQAVQFMPAVVLPQLLLSGLLQPVDRLPGALEAVAHLLPMTYAVEAMGAIARSGVDGEVLLDAAVVGGAALLALVAGAATLRRRTA